jgi:hypothetical protein
MAGYPRVIGRYYPGFGQAADPGLAGAAGMKRLAGYIAGYLAGEDVDGEDVDGEEEIGRRRRHHRMAMQRAPEAAGGSAPWRAMVAPGNPPIGEHHVPLPLNPETYNGTWSGPSGAGSGAAQAPSGTIITFSARPQKPYKTARLIAKGTKFGATAVGNLIAQVFVGTSLQQGELGYFDLESIGAATAFDTWVSLHQAEPGVWIRVQGTLTAFPTGSDFEVYTVSALGHYLQ